MRQCRTGPIRYLSPIYGRRPAETSVEANTHKTTSYTTAGLSDYVKMS